MEVDSETDREVDPETDQEAQWRCSSASATTAVRVAAARFHSSYPPASLSPSAPDNITNITNLSIIIINNCSNSSSLNYQSPPPLLLLLLPFCRPT